MDAEARSRLMSRIKSKGTSPEAALGKALWHAGMRYRLQYGKEKIDIAFPGEKLAVFVDGCFWHSCPIHGHMPKSNIPYWAPKLAGNIERAKAKDLRLQEAGWETMHFWEHEVKANAEECAGKVAAELYYTGKTRICISCNYENPEEAKYCMNCGARLE